MLTWGLGTGLRDLGGGDAVRAGEQVVGVLVLGVPVPGVLILGVPVLGVLVPVVIRFLAGRVVWRRRGPWDATYLRWGVLVAPQVAVLRSPGLPGPPRTRWARRPGWQRQAVRLAALTVLLGVWLVLWLTCATALGAALALLVEGAVRRARADGVEDDDDRGRTYETGWPVPPPWPDGFVGAGVGGRAGEGLPEAPLWVSANRADRAGWPGRSGGSSSGCADGDWPW